MARKRAPRAAAMKRMAALSASLSSLLRPTPPDEELNGGDHEAKGDGDGSRPTVDPPPAEQRVGREATWTEHADHHRNQGQGGDVLPAFVGATEHEEAG